jgi:hypothetical protein
MAFELKPASACCCTDDGFPQEVKEAIKQIDREILDRQIHP